MTKATRWICSKRGILARTSTLAVILALLCTVTGCQRGLDPIVYGSFQSAQSAFDQADTEDEFRDAAARYQEILDSGVVSGVVFYNQGNAFMWAGMRGHAIACYRQALRYRPRDAYLDANLRYALGTSASKASKPLIEYLLFWQRWISYPGKFLLSQLLASATLVIASAGVWWRRRGLGRMALVSLAVTLLAVVSATYDWYQYSYTRHGVVIDETVARKGNSESYQPAFTQPLAEATEFTLLERRSDWLHVRLSTGQAGWIPIRSAGVY